MSYKKTPITRVGIVVFVLSVLLFGIAGCAGGTMGTGLTYGLRDANRSGVQYRMFRGKVVSEVGKPLPSVAITAKTSEGSEETESSARGTFKLLVTRRKDEQFITTFTLRGKSWKLTLKQVPSSTVVITLKDDGSLDMKKSL